MDRKRGRTGSAKSDADESKFESLNVVPPPATSSLEYFDLVSLLICFELRRTDVFRVELFHRRQLQRPSRCTRIWSTEQSRRSSIQWLRRCQCRYTATANDRLSSTNPASADRAITPTNWISAAATGRFPADASASIHRLPSAEPSADIPTAAAAAAEPAILLPSAHGPSCTEAAAAADRHDFLRACRLVQIQTASSPALQRNRRKLRVNRNPQAEAVVYHCSGSSEVRAALQVRRWERSGAVRRQVQRSASEIEITRRRAVAHMVG